MGDPTRVERTEWLVDVVIRTIHSAPEPTRTYVRVEMAGESLANAPFVGEN
jgi:hypothetical protein